MTQLTLPDTRELRPQTPRQLLESALAWIADNPHAWDFIVGAAQRDALDGVPISTKFYIEAMRRRRDLSWATDAVKIPNAFSPALSRILVAWHPYLAPHIKLAPSKLDGCTIPPRVV